MIINDMNDKKKRAFNRESKNNRIQLNRDNKQKKRFKIKTK